MKTSTLFTHALYSNIFYFRGAIENKQTQQKYSIIWVFLIYNFAATCTSLTTQRGCLLYAVEHWATFLTARTSLTFQFESKYAY